MKHILITGINSYIGNSTATWLNKFPELYSVKKLSLRNLCLNKIRFSDFDVIFHVSGIAHSEIETITDEQKQLYYKINTELAIETAKKAKEAGVKQFIFMSSINIYSGCKELLITAATLPKPLNFYGASKWQADQKIRSLADDQFKVVVIRSPMIYGKGCKGNYAELSKLAGKLPIFPSVKNKRSMLHIDNLCEFVKLIIDNEENGVFFPQNNEYSNTSDMVRMIANVKKHHILMIPCTDLMIKVMGKIPGKVGRLVVKAFGNSAYDMELSEYHKGNYRIRTLYESIQLTESHKD